MTASPSSPGSAGARGVPPLTGTAPLLVVDGLSLRAPTSVPVDGVSFEVQPREVFGIAGHSGAGKSLTVLSILGLLPSAVSVSAGRIEWRGEDLLRVSPGRLRQVRRAEIGIVFQEAQSALHPSHRIRDQVAEALRTGGAGRKAAREEALDLLDSVGVPDPRQWGERYPHEWSGGMRQRGLIALALANRRTLLIADEPTSSLDVTVQAQIMELLAGLRDSRGLSLVLVSHDLALLAEYADSIAIMKEGRIVERGAVADLLERPTHSVTRRLVASWTSTTEAGSPRDHPERAQPANEPEHLLVVRDLHAFPGGVPAVRGVDLVVRARECVALVGESGCGKSTLARALVGLVPHVKGSVTYRGRLVVPGARADLLRLQREAQLVFQDPSASLNPRRSVGWSVGRPIQLHESVPTSDRRRRVRELLIRVGLPPAYADRRPHELSGGERQRAAIARALSVHPRLIILDEPFSALDAHLRSALIDLLAGLRRELGLSYLLISHDLHVVRALAGRMYVIYLGRVAEQGDVTTVMEQRRHPYTRALVSAEPRRGLDGVPSATRLVLPGEVPNPLAAPTGCAFRLRCWRNDERCATHHPPLAPLQPGQSLERGHGAACFHPCPVPLSP